MAKFVFFGVFSNKEVAQMTPVPPPDINMKAFDATVTEYARVRALGGDTTPVMDKLLEIGGESYPELAHAALIDKGWAQQIPCGRGDSQINFLLEKVKADLKL